MRNHRLFFVNCVLSALAVSLCSSSLAFASPAKGARIAEKEISHPLRRGETLIDALVHEGFSKAETFPVADMVGDEAKHLHPGDKVAIHFRTENGKKHLVKVSLDRGGKTAAAPERAAAAKPKDHATRYSGSFSRGLSAELRRANIPDSVQRQMEQGFALVEDFPAFSQPVSGRYDVLAVKRDGKVEIVKASVRIDRKEHKIFRVAEGDKTEWVDARGRLLTAPNLIRPVAGGRITSPFGWRIHPVLGDRRFHNGVDFALQKGSPVFAAETGWVTEIEERGNYGKVIRLNHGNGTETVYAHLDDFMRGLHVGSHVRRGQKIATVGDSGLATGPHLYWEVVMDEQHLDPLAVLDNPKTLPPKEWTQFCRYADKLEKDAEVIRRM